MFPNFSFPMILHTQSDEILLVDYTKQKTSMRTGNGMCGTAPKVENQTFLYYTNNLAIPNVLIMMVINIQVARCIDICMILEHILYIN